MTQNSKYGSTQFTDAEIEEILAAEQKKKRFKMMCKQKMSQPQIIEHNAPRIVYYQP